jgi:putative ABC transport system permease protein
MGTLLAIFNSLPGAVAQGLIWGILAIGVYITYKILDIADLTVDGSMCTGGAVCVMLMIAGWPAEVALTAAVIAGMLTGLVTGVLHTWMGIPPILSGILTQLALYSVNLKIMGKANQALNYRNYDLTVSLQYIRKLPVFENTIFIIAVFVIVIIGVLYWFFGTEYGCAMRATGSNHTMSRAQGINTNLKVVTALMISNGLVALSGGLLAQYQGFADVQMGRGAIVIGLAAVIIGGALFGKIFKNFGLKLLGVALGSVVYYIVYQTVICVGLDPDLLKLLSSVVVAIFLAIPYWKSKLHTKNRRGGKVHAAN